MIVSVHILAKKQTLLSAKPPRPEEMTTWSQSTGSCGLAGQPMKALVENCWQAFTMVHSSQSSWNSRAKFTSMTLVLYRSLCRTGPPSYSTFSQWQETLVQQNHWPVASQVTNMAGQADSWPPGPGHKPSSTWELSRTWTLFLGCYLGCLSHRRKKKELFQKLFFLKLENHVLNFELLRITNPETHKHEASV